MSGLNDGTSLPRPSGRILSVSCLALASTLFLAACGGDGAGDDTGEGPAVRTDAVRTDAVADSPTARPNVVHITLQGDSPVVDIDSVCGWMGQTVQWMWAGSDTISGWLVKFAGISPFQQGDTLIRSRPNNPRAPSGGTIAQGLEGDSVFSYVVQVVDTMGNTMGRDPDIVIKDPSLLRPTTPTCRDTADAQP